MEADVSVVRRIAAITLTSLVVSACSIGGFEPATLDLPTSVVTLDVVDEQGRAVPEAVFHDVHGGTTEAAGGTIELDITDARAGTVSARGYLTEPIVVDPDQTRLEVRLWSETSADGTPRIAMHFGGDTMLGRRYLDPGREGTPIVDPEDDGSSAREVVSDIAAVFGAADISMVNLETVVGEEPTEEAAAGKRFLLQSPPVVTAALHELGVDVVALGNNHTADWGDAGVASTLEVLAGSDILGTGAGLDDASARRPAIVDVRGLRVGVLSYTSLTGALVNGVLPRSDSATPARLAEHLQWPYEFRPFSYGDPGDDVYLEAGPHRAGDVWQWFDDLDLTRAEQVPVWTAMVEVFPELQDWVARRGHGGAALFRTSAITDDIAALRADGADLVVVQFHSGPQFADVGSGLFSERAHLAVDLGADLVIGHHSHTLQGFEWYQGRLIAHSLGNLVFDQDFMATFSTVVLRTVHEGSTLLEARVLPISITDYRPSFVSGSAAQKILRELRADSTGFAPSDMIDWIVARNVDIEGVAAADLAIEGNAATLIDPLAPRSLTLEPDDRGIATVPDGVLLSVADVPPGVALGRELLRWGSFDDVLADGTQRGAANWALSEARRADVVPVDDTGHDLALRLTPTRTNGALVRPVARVPAPRHRFYDDAGEWVDGEPDYAVRMRIRRSGPVSMVVRLDLYHFDDTDRLLDPESTSLGRVEVPIDLTDTEEWQEVEVLVPAGSFDPVAGVDPNAVMIYLTVPSGTPTEVLVDDLQLIEWRDARDLPEDLWMEADVIRSTADEVTITVR